jgi:hypothetical protein
MSGELERLTKWYRSHCDGDWEHQSRVKLGTIDNPGWSLDVNLVDTATCGKVVPHTSVDRTDTDWLFYEVKDDLFRGRCGAGNLAEMLDVFLNLVEEGDA